MSIETNSSNYSILSCKYGGVFRADKYMLTARKGLVDSRKVARKVDSLSMVNEFKDDQLTQVKSGRALELI